MSERLRFSHGRLKLGPWQYGLDSGKYIGAAGTRLDERLAYPGVEPYFLVDRFAASVELLGVDCTEPVGLFRHEVRRASHLRGFAPGGRR